ncbi:hypothetical protein [Helicobacter ailurogastricus]|uniref:hypothetical protein n=1 Tax=Helicobacter ailurogastricus TaxID=1578720 RepID=UPI0006B4DDBB|nr:hypothetical protein [Helicobacter ailurogastricus]
MKPLWLGGVLLSFLGCAGSPAWVQNCPAKAYLQQNDLFACAGAPVVDQDVDFATNVASAKAKDKMAAWVLIQQKRAAEGPMQVELVGVHLESQWVGPSQVYVLLRADAKEAKKAKITPRPTPKPTEPQTQEPKAPAKAIEPKEKAETKAQGSEAGTPKAEAPTPKAIEAKPTSKTAKEGVATPKPTTPKETETPKALEQTSAPKEQANPKQESLTKQREQKGKNENSGVK